LLRFATFGKYEITRKLSRSMTDVYLAHDTEADRPAVLKLIELSQDEYTRTVIEAERRGAILQKQLHALDRRILQIYEFGEENGCFFVAMEYFAGRTLAEILQAERRLDARRAAHYAAEICSQLRTLHSFASDIDGRKTAIVHGDVKPSNVQISDRDELRLLDFGIAKGVTVTHNLTHHNLGSPSYCSPERISTSHVDQYSDLWALGVSLYEMVAGTPPYQAQDTRRLENLILTRRPPRALPDDCPAALKAIIAKALAGNVAHRYASAQEFESDLVAFLKGQTTAAETESTPAWNANATVVRETAAPASNGGTTKPTGKAESAKTDTTKRTTPKKGWWNEFSNVAIALLAGILAGVLILIPVSYYYRFVTSAAKLRINNDYARQGSNVIASDWSLYEQLRTHGGMLGRIAPMADLDALMQTKLLKGADGVLEQYRTSTDSQLRDFDWAKARLCLEKALEIKSNDKTAAGKLALVNGYALLARSTSMQAAIATIKSFRSAASDLPHSPDPHVALARVYLKPFHNLTQAVTELQQAQQLGYKLGPREFQSEAEGYLYRAEFEMAKARRTTTASERAKWLNLTKTDMDRARKLYEPLASSIDVSSGLAELQQDQEQEAMVETASLQSEKTQHTKTHTHWRVYR
jgi:serine/threonine protein kinase